MSDGLLGSGPPGLLGGDSPLSSALNNYVDWWKRGPLGGMIAGTPPEQREPWDPAALAMGFIGPGSVKAVGGQTLKLFHGTNTDFPEFKPGFAGSRTDAGQLGRGIYFSSDPRVGVGSKYLKEATATLTNPLHLTMPDMRTGKSTLITQALGLPKTANATDISESLHHQGYDGVILDYTPIGYAHQEVMVLNPRNIRMGHGDLVREAKE